MTVFQHAFFFKLLLFLLVLQLPEVHLLAERKLRIITTFIQKNCNNVVCLIYEQKTYNKKR